MSLWGEIWYYQDSISIKLEAKQCENYREGASAIRTAQIIHINLKSFTTGRAVSWVYIGTMTWLPTIQGFGLETAIKHSTKKLSILRDFWSVLLDGWLSSRNCLPFIWGPQRNRFGGWGWKREKQRTGRREQNWACSISCWNINRLDFAKNNVQLRKTYLL